MFLLFLAAGPAGAGTFIADSSEQSVWVLSSRNDPRHGEVLLLAVRQEGRREGDAFVFPQNIRAQTGWAKWTAVRGNRLHVIFGDKGDHMSYSADTGGSPETWLPDRYIPESFAADAAGDRLCAVVPTWLAAKIPEPAETSQPGSGPTSASSSTHPATPAFSRRTATPQAVAARSLVSFGRGRWWPGVPIPDRLLPEGGRLFLAVTGKKIHLLARSKAAKPIRHAVYDGKSWSGRPSFGADWNVELRRLLTVPVGPAGRLVLVATRPTEDDRRVALRFAGLRGETWTLTEPVANDGEVLTVDPDNFTEAVVENWIALFRREADGAVSMAEADLAGRIVKPFESIRVFEPVSEPALTPQLRIWLTPVLLITILLVLYWRRSDSTVEFVELPAGIRLAPLWARFAGLLIDLAPAVLITVPLWWPAVSTERILWNQLLLDPTVIPANLYGSCWVLRIIYAVYCGVFEAVLGRTPGKMLTNCRVVDVSAGRPGPATVLVRNLFRLVETEPLLSVWWVVILVLLTRNRQRLGDILARTIVVQDVPSTSSMSEPGVGSEEEED